MSTREELVTGGKAGRLVPASAARRRPTRRRSPTSCYRLARLGDDLPEVAELDLNPVIALPDGCVAVDARVRVRAAGASSARRPGRCRFASRADVKIGSRAHEQRPDCYRRDRPLDRRRAAPHRRATGAPRTTSPSARSTCSTTRCCASRSRPEHVKPRLLGHFGTTPGLNLVYAHLNRAIRARDLNAIYVTGPGHGGPALVANAYLEGTYSELYPHVGRDEDGLRELFRQFSFPGGIPSHAAPETPGSIHEGGELGYALAHAFGAAFDNPDLLVACVVGDGEAETGPLAASWHSNKFLNPRTRRRRAADPAPERLQDREPDRARADPGGRARRALRGLRLPAAARRRATSPSAVHQRFAAALDDALDEIAAIQRGAREDGDDARGRAGR